MHGQGKAKRTELHRTDGGGLVKVVVLQPSRQRHRIQLQLACRAMQATGLLHHSTLAELAIKRVHLYLELPFATIF